MPGVGIKMDITKNNTVLAGVLKEARLAFGARVKRQRLVLRAFRARKQLKPLINRTRSSDRNGIRLFCCVRNEMSRLPYFLAHYRAIGVRDFVFIDNASTDGTVDYLSAQPDVSVWSASHSYRASRFGMDWLNWLLLRYGSGRWCVTVDADELLVFPHIGERSLGDLTAWLDDQNVPMMAAIMLDLYPKGPLSSAHCAAGLDPTTVLNWFDANNYTWQFQPRYRNISIRGGPRMRMFFAANPEHAPHLHKVPLIRWHWRYAYVSSMHVVLPRRLNAGFDVRNDMPTGVLLHDKFRDEIIAKSRDEKKRGEHFTYTQRYDDYYDALIADPVLWTDDSRKYNSWRDLEEEGLMVRGSWK